MDHLQSSYDLNELAEAADVTPRTIRYYIQQGLLPPPGTRGPATRYEEAHLDRIRLIKRLQREHLPLAEIRQRLSAMDDAEVRRALRLAREFEPRTSALEYVQNVLSAGKASFAAAPDATRATPDRARGGLWWPYKSQWERITLAPDVELHVRRPLSREQNKAVDQLLKLARRVFGENEP